MTSSKLNRLNNCLKMADSQYPIFKLGESRFNQSTFTGRLRHFLEVVDPRSLLIPERKLEESIKLLEDYKNGNLATGVTDRQLWEAQRIKQAIIHPDTGKKIFQPFRMSGYVPYGSITVIGLLLPNQSIREIIFWQWINQSHNACVNYANRNASKPAPASRFIIGYTGAVTSAVGIAVGLSAFLRKASSFPAATRVLIERFIPYPAVACANIFNVFLMRNSELRDGIEVFDKDKKLVGTSKKAARKAVTETAMTRAFLPAPVLLLPPLIMTQLEKTRFLKSRPRFVLPIQALVCIACFGLGLPLAISLFPQTSKVKASELEHEISSSTGEDILYYNKGL